MTKLTRLGVIIAAAVALSAVAAGQQPSHGNAFSEAARVGLWHSSQVPGGELDILLFAEKIPPPGLGAWTLNVNYDASAVAVAACEVDLADALSFCDWQSTQGEIRVIGASASGLEGNFTLARILFRCSDRNRIVTTDLRLTVQTFADSTSSDPQDIEAEHYDGLISCEPENPGIDNVVGDVNCDDTVDALDAALVLQYTSAVTNRVSCLINADVNHNGYFDSIDAALILQYSAGLVSSLN